MARAAADRAVNLGRGRRHLVVAGVPLAAVVVAALAATFFALPLVGLLTRVPWATAWRLLTSPDAADAVRLSLVTSVAATALALVLGVPLAWVQARVAYPGRRLVR